MSLRTLWASVRSKCGYNYPDYTALPSSDRKVASGPTDPGADTLIKKVASPLGTLNITEDTAGHIVDFDVVPPSINGGKLWTAFVPDPLVRASVDAVFHEQGGCDPKVFGTVWTEIATGVWRRNVAGHLEANRTDDVGAWVGMRVFAWSANVEGAHTGIYVITDIGLDPVTHADTYPQMQRADDLSSSSQALHGLYFTVSQGTAWAGQAFQLTTADPIELDVTVLTWEILYPVPSGSPTKELLTASQLGLASTATVTATVGYVSAGSGELDLVTCTEHDAVLGGTVLSGTGTFRFHVPVWLTADDPAATTVVNCYVRGNAHTPWVLVATTQPLHNTSVGVFIPVGTLGSDYALAIGEELQVRYTAVSNSTGLTGHQVTVNLTYNDAAHTSYIEIPATIGYAGTSYHPDLSGRNLPDQHIRRALTTVEKPPLSLDGSGNLTPDPGADVVLLSSEVTINRIDASQWPSGSGELTLHFTSKGHLTNQAANSGTFCGLELGNSGGLSGAEAAMLDFGLNGIAKLLLSGNAWVLCYDNTGTT